MPLLQDTSRGGGGPNENRRSLADFLGFDATRIEPAAAPSNHRGNDCKGEEWRWEEARSPQAAQTPRALVPPTCFPPRHPTAFASFSESARPGTGWNDDSSSQGITDLVTSLKALAMPSVPAAARRLETSIQMRLSYEASEQNSDSWAADPPQTSLPRDERYISRRASFCGVDCRGGGGGGGSGGAARWSGVLPARGEVVAEYSPKLFMGGLPFDISEQALMHALRHFHPVRVEWPGRENNGSSSLGPRGFAYVTFESERRVRALLAASRRDGTDWYYRVSTRKIRTKEVIPWAVCDASWVCGGCTRLEPARTVFVGALHGMLSAHALATIMNDLFQGVVYAGIDTDKNKYPIGSGRVTFNNVHSYVRAISAAYVEITTDKFTKKVQVDPYLEDSMCSECNLHQGPYFCRQPMCFRYFCRGCWVWRHGAGAAGGAGGVEHKPLTRSARTHNNHGNTHSPPASTHAIDGIPSPSTSGNNEATPSPDEPLESDSVWEPR